MLACVGRARRRIGIVRIAIEHEQRDRRVHAVGAADQRAEIVETLKLRARTRRPETRAVDGDTILRNPVRSVTSSMSCARIRAPRRRRAHAGLGFATRAQTI